MWTLELNRKQVDWEKEEVTLRLSSDSWRVACGRSKGPMPKELMLTMHPKQTLTLAQCRAAFLILAGGIEATSLQVMQGGTVILSYEANTHERS